MWKRPWAEVNDASPPPALPPLVQDSPLYLHFGIYFHPPAEQVLAPVLRMARDEEPKPWGSELFLLHFFPSLLHCSFWWCLWLQDKLSPVTVTHIWQLRFDLVVSWVLGISVREQSHWKMCVGTQLKDITAKKREENYFWWLLYSIIHH